MPFKPIAHSLFLAMMLFLVAVAVWRVHAEPSFYLKLYPPRVSMAEENGLLDIQFWLWNLLIQYSLVHFATTKLHLDSNGYRWIFVFLLGLSPLVALLNPIELFRVFTRLSYIALYLFYPIIALSVFLLVFIRKRRDLSHVKCAPILFLAAAFLAFGHLFGWIVYTLLYEYKYQSLHRYSAWLECIESMSTLVFPLFLLLLAARVRLNKFIKLDWIVLVLPFVFLTVLYIREHQITNYYEFRSYAQLATPAGENIIDAIPDKMPASASNIMISYRPGDNTVYMAFDFPATDKFYRECTELFISHDTLYLNRLSSYPPFVYEVDEKINNRSNYNLGQFECGKYSKRTEITIDFEIPRAYYSGYYFKASQWHDPRLRH